MPFDPLQALRSGANALPYPFNSTGVGQAQRALQGAWKTGQGMGRQLDRNIHAATSGPAGPAQNFANNLWGGATRARPLLQRPSMGGGPAAAPAPTAQRAPMAVRPGDPAPAIGYGSRPAMTMNSDQGYRAMVGRQTGVIGNPGDAGIDPSDPMAGWKMKGSLGGDRYELHDSGSQRLAAQLRQQAGDMGDLQGTDLGNAISGYLQEQAGRHDGSFDWRGLPDQGAGFYGADKQVEGLDTSQFDLANTRQAFGPAVGGKQPNWNTGANAWQQGFGAKAQGADPSGLNAPDAGDSGVPVGTTYQGKTWNGTSWASGDAPSGLNAPDAGDSGVPVGTVNEGKTWDGVNWVGGSNPKGWAAGDLVDRYSRFAVNQGNAQW